MDFSRISDSLFIGTAPTSQDYDLLRQMGVKLVINMRVERGPDPDPHNPPIAILWLPVFDTPLIPIPIKSLKRGVAAALKTIQQGGKVYAHCQEGIHRGVAMGAAILIAQGLSPQEAIALVKQCRPVADPDAWYIRQRIYRFAKSWQTDPYLQ
jgi:protein-tyrosine phosphatase